MTTTSNTDTTSAVEVIGLTKIYGSGNTEVVAMKDVTLSVARGEVIALLGPSGAGKSTLLTAIGLINPPTAGRIHIGGEWVMELFRKVAHERVAAVIVVTHDQRSLDVFDRTFEMEDGRLKSGDESTDTSKP